MLIRVRSNEAIRPTHLKHRIHTNIVMRIYDLAASPACLLQWQEARVKPATAIKAGVVQVRALRIVTYSSNWPCAVGSGWVQRTIKRGLPEDPRIAGRRTSKQCYCSGQTVGWRASAGIAVYHGAFDYRSPGRIREFCNVIDYIELMQAIEGDEYGLFIWTFGVRSGRR